MASNELDPLVAEILLKGDDEFLSKIKKIGEDAADHFEKLSAKVLDGAKSAEVLTGALGLIEAALAAATAATVAFIEQQTELSQKTMLLADAFGVTAGQLQDIEATFASAGVKVEQFERFANRLTITIAREWPQIAESIRNYATESDAATLRVSSAILRVRDAQKALADNSAERAATIAKDNLSLEASYIKLQFAAQHAASEAKGALLSISGAALSTRAALQHLAEVQSGKPASKEDKHALEEAQAIQAVDQARKAEADARVAAQEKAAQATLKMKQAEQEYDDLARKAAKNARDDAEQREKDENAIKGAVIARAEAEQKEAKLALTNIASIREGLNGIVTGNKSATSAVNLTEVSVQNLTKAIIAQAAQTSKTAQPTGYETMISLSKTLAADTEHLITAEQRLAIVNHLAATGMQALGGVGAELLHVLEHDTAQLERLNDQVKALDTKEAKTAVQDFRGALALLTLDISILSQRFAIAASPAFTAFLNAIRKSFEDNNGVIHAFISGLQELGRIIGRVIEGAENIATAFAKWIGLKDSGPVWIGIFVALGVAIAAAASALLAWPLIIAGIITVIGYIAENWDKVKKGAEQAWQSVMDSSIMTFLKGVLDLVTKIWGFFSKIFGSSKTTPNNPDKGSNASGGKANEAPMPGNAEGGYISGPGSGTSDSIISRLSNGEFVVRAAAVQAYGAELFHSLNNMMIPGFASGGLVPSPVRMGGGNVPATSVLNLSIDGRSFNGLKGPKSTIDDLSSFAIARQASAAGSNPSWMK
jgi:hypothetical protein